MSERDYETEAKAEGWVPKADFKGDASKWVDAETFVKRGEEILPIVNAKNRKLSEQVESLMKEVSELKTGNAQFREFHDKALAREQRDKAQLIEQLEAIRKKAVTDSDGEAFAKADRQLQDLRKEPEQKNGELSPVQKGWLADNPWYESDEELQAIADGLSGVLAKRRPDLIGKRAFLDELTNMVKKQVPDKFENPNRQRTTVEDTQQRGKQGNGRTYDDLPSDAKSACDRFVRTIPGFTKEKYLASYEWD